MVARLWRRSSLEGWRKKVLRLREMGGDIGILMRGSICRKGS